MKEQIPTFYVKYRFNTAKAELINSDTVPQGTPTDTLSGARVTTGPNGETINRKDAYYSEYEAYLIDALYLKEAEIEAKTEKGKKPQKMDMTELRFKSDFPDEEFKIMWTELPRETLEASATARGQRTKAKCCGVLRNPSDRFLWNFPTGADSGRKFIRAMPIRRQIDRGERTPDDDSRLARIPGGENAKKINGYELIFPKGMLMGAYFIAPSNLQAKLQLLKETDKNKNLFPESEARYQVTVQLARKFFLYFGVHKYAKTGAEEDPRSRTIEYRLEDLFREIRPSLLKKNGKLYSEHKAGILAEQLVRIYQAIVNDMPRCPVFEITDFKAQESRKETILETGKTVRLPASLTLTFRQKEPPRRTPWKRRPGSRRPHRNKRHKK